MRFSTITAAALVGLAAASPSSLAKRENQAMTKAIQFAALADDCDLFSCAAVVGAAGCIAVNIPLGPAGVPGALACLSGGAASVTGRKE
jgi:hypothetical protein